MKINRIVLIGFIVSLFTTSALLAQILTSSRVQGSPQFTINIQNVAGDDDMSALVVKVNIPYDELQFLKKKNKEYRAEVELTIILRNQDEEQVFAKTYKKAAITSNYDSTNSNLIYSQFNISVEAAPGEYNFLCQVTDLDSKNTGEFSRKIKMEDFNSQELSVSDLFLLNSKILNSNKIEWLKDQFSDNLKDDQNFLVTMFEIYSKTQSDFEIEYALLDFRNKQLEKGKFKQLKKEFRTEVYIPFSQSVLSSGRYTLSLKIKTSKNRIEVKRYILRQVMQGSLYLLENLEESISQMQYLTDREEVDKIKRAPPQKKQKLFEEFWAKKDPTPGTPTNELMDEYYRRIAYSNAHFSVMRPGWKSDMGMVYVLFGAPNDVDREPFNAQASIYSARQIHAYEQWYYFERNRQFIFADYYGVGEFQLLNPEELYRDR